MKPYNIFDLFKNALPKSFTNGKPSRGAENLHRRYGVEPQLVDDQPSSHAGVFLGNLKFKLPRMLKRKTGRSTIPTQHDRVVAGRARRMGISVKEYERRFPPG